MKDILLDDDYDLLIGKDDLLLAESTQQEIQLLLYSEKGDWKFSPVTGVGMREFIKAPGNGRELENEVRKQFLVDGLTLSQLSVSWPVTGQVSIDVQATRPQ